VVVARAGVGLDNIDVEAATKQGVMVVNAPQSNVLSAAEHTMALILSIARNVPQAHSALTAGRWERSKWEGIELAGKTLGILGLGRIGTLVAQRARAFDMRLVAYDPYVSAERGRELGVEMTTLERVVEQADVLTIHLPKNKETTGIINADMLKRAKRSLRIVNVARGGIADEADLAEALRNGTIAGAALDVFTKEPVTDSPLFGLGNIVVTPHLVPAHAKHKTARAKLLPTWCNLRSTATSCLSLSTSKRAMQTKHSSRLFHWPIASGAYLRH
jgi:D-3-phosphoglycerate dehydrogenase